MASKCDPEYIFGLNTKKQKPSLKNIIAQWWLCWNTALPDIYLIPQIMLCWWVSESGSDTAQVSSFHRGHGTNLTALKVYLI